MYYQKPCLFNTTLLDWVTKCNTSFPQLPQIRIIQGLCEEKPSSIWGVICCNKCRINADVFLKQAPKLQACSGGWGGGVLGAYSPWKIFGFTQTGYQDIGQFHSPQIGGNVVAKSLPFCKERALSWIWPIFVKRWKSVWILVCARVAFHFPFYFFGLQTKQCWDITSRLSQLEPYSSHPLFK